MKKLGILFLCAALALQAAAPWYTSAAAKAYGTGLSLRLDVDSSGAVDLKDCALAAQLAAGWNLNTALRERADVNGDDLVDLKDVTVLAGLVVGSPRWANHAENNTAYDWPELEPGTARAGTVISGSEKPEKAEGTLQSFTLLTQNNNELGFNLACSISGGEVTALLPAGTNLASLVPSFESTKPLYYGGKRLYSGFSTVDFTRPVVLRAGSPNSSEQYELYLKTFNTGLPSFCITTESYEPINSKVERKNCTVFAGGGNREKKRRIRF